MARFFIWSIVVLGLAGAVMASDSPQLAPIKASLPEPVRNVVDQGRNGLLALAGSLPEPVRKLIGPRTSTDAQGAPKSGSAAPAPAAGGPRRAIPPAPVVTSTAKVQNVPVRLEGIGTVLARSTVAVKTRLDGQLLEAAVKEGQVVKKGDLLFRIDPRPFEAALRQAEANLARDRAAYEKARADYARAAELVGKGITPKSRFDDTKASLGALEATLRAGQAAIDVAKLNLGYTEIRSPIDGKVGNLLVHPGNMIKANDTQAMIVITEVDPVHVAFAVPEHYLPQVRELMGKGKIMVDVWAPVSRANVSKGELFFLNNAVDTTTGTITLMASVPNVDQRLIPGQFVHASVVATSLQDVVVVPSRAVQIGQRGTFVYVVKGDTVEMRPVTTGPSVDDVTVIAKGLQKDEPVVSEGQLRLFPGAKIVPKTGAPQAPAKPKEQS
jgi:multidrug efflux system membrane fusion protein